MTKTMKFQQVPFSALFLSYCHKKQENLFASLRKTFWLRPSALDAFIKHGLAEVQDDKPARIPIPSLVWQGIDAVRLSGLTNMLDRPVVARPAGELGYPDAASRIEEHPKEYAEGVFRGFIVHPQGGKS
jgi:hypothetical protein